MAVVKHYRIICKTILVYATDLRYKYGPEVHAESAKEFVEVP